MNHHAAELLYRTELRKFPSINNTAYRNSFRCIGDFFRQLESGGQLTFHATYPVLGSLEGLSGEEYVERYLECYHYENQFLRMFDADSVQRCLSLYAMIAETEVRDLHCNLCEIVLACALRSIDYGNITNGSFDFEVASAALLGRMGCTSESLNRYIAQACRTRKLRIWEIQALMRLATVQVGKDIPE